jgi:hypothetical protein
VKTTGEWLPAWIIAILLREIHSVSSVPFGKSPVGVKSFFGVFEIGYSIKMKRRALKMRESVAVLEGGLSHGILIERDCGLCQKSPVY